MDEYTTYGEIWHEIRPSTPPTSTSTPQSWGPYVLGRLFQAFGAAIENVLSPKNLSLLKFIRRSWRDFEYELTDKFIFFGSLKRRSAVTQVVHGQAPLFTAEYKSVLTNGGDALKLGSYNRGPDRKLWVTAFFWIYD